MTDIVALLVIVVPLATAMIASIRAERRERASPNADETAGGRPQPR